MEELINNLSLQLSEIEMLKSMFPGEKEFVIEDPLILSDTENFINGKDSYPPPEIEFSIQLTLGLKAVLSLFSKFPQTYPAEKKPQILVRCSSMSKAQDKNFNDLLREFIAGIDQGTLCIGIVIDWIKENAEAFIDSNTDATARETADRVEHCRLWIYSHHIYNKTKRKNILDWAEELDLRGFVAPGKPGIICVEGEEQNCNQWWQRVRSLNWQRIACKLREFPESEDVNTWKKFKDFKEVTFANNSSTKTSDMGALLRFLEQHQCAYVFKDYFGFEGK